MIIVDVEASGTNPYKHSLVSVGALDFEHPDNRFYEECRIWEGAHIDDEALAVNGFSREEVTFESKQTDEELIKKFLKWIEQFDDRTIAGQNPSFDRDFLQATAERYHLNWPLAYRTIDVHSVCVAHMIKRGKSIPVVKNRSALDLDAILRYVGIPEEPEPHNALTGALVEAEALSRLLYDKPLLEEFRQYKIPWL
jgi:DNA polymerase III epsilon subunit-like protein